MGLFMVLISNNPAFYPVRSSGLCVVPIDGSGYDVIVAARDRIHLGWTLLNHPLYGNFRPYQQPFRTVLLRSPVPSAVPPPVDESSLAMVENAMSVYLSCKDRWLAPKEAPHAVWDDCSVLDYDLMKETLIKEGILF